jgi:hypothetical protein
VFAASDIAVTIANNLGVETALVLNADYSVTLNSNQDTSPGGTVTYPISGSALPTGSRLTIFGNLPYDQPLDLPSGGNFSPLALENQLDRLTMQIQQLRELANRSLQLPVTSAPTNVQLPQPAASNIIGWNENGDNLENYPLSELATSLAFATYRYDTFTGNGSTTQFTLSADPVTLGNLDVAVGGVTQTPGTDYLLVDGVLEFTSAPPNGVTILARFGEGIASGPSMDSYDVRFRQAGTGSVDRTAESKMRESVSVKDFGAVGDNVADDTAAIQAAINSNVSGLSVYFPHGRYRITSTIIVPTNKSLKMYGDGFNPQDLTPIFGSIVMWDGPVNGTMFSSNTNDGLNLSGWVIKDLRMDGGNKASVGLVSSALGAHPQHHYFENVEIANFAINGSDPALDLAGSPVSRFGVADATFINCIFSGGARAVRINCQQLNFFSCTFGAKSGGTLIELGDNAHPKFFGCGFYGSPGVDCVFGIQTAIGIDGLQCYGCWNEGQLRLLARLPGLPFVPAVGALRVLFSGQRSACDPAGAAGFMIDLRGLGCNLVWEGGSNDNVSSARVAIEDGSSMTVYGLSAGAFDFASVTGGGNALEYANGGVRLYGGDGVNSNYALRNNVAITALNTAKTFRANLIKIGTDDIIDLGSSATGTPTRMYKGPSANFYAPSASMDGVIGVNETLGELVFYVNGQRYRVAGTAY